MFSQVKKLGAAFACFVMAACVVFVSALPAAADTPAPKSVAMLGVSFQNDNEGYEPTSNAERARITALEAQFKLMLEASGGYNFVAMTPEVQAKINAGQPIGTCGGCEIGYGKALGANTVAWVQVQKISNLIMNMNVYIGDVASNKMLFIHSVDIRGNTDESWSRSMKYLLDNYLLVPGG